jgi:hypothetical protein
MPKRSSKPDVNEIAFQGVQSLIDKLDPQPLINAEKEKNPAAVALGRLGGQKGGKARAEKLSAAKRKAIAKKAAKARWEKRD